MEQDLLRTTYNEQTQPVTQQVCESASFFEGAKPLVQENGLRYRFERYGSRNWAVYDGDELVAVTVYKKGAKSVVTRLQKYENCL